MATAATTACNAPSSAVHITPTTTIITTTTTIPLSADLQRMVKNRELVNQIGDLLKHEYPPRKGKH